MSERFFEVIAQDKFSITIKTVKNIEDCGDEILTESELEEMGIRNGMYGNTRKVFNKKVTNAILGLKSQIKEGCKSIKIADLELLDIFKDDDLYITPSYLVDGCSRSGNRLVFKDKSQPSQQKKVLMKNWRQMVYLFQFGMFKKFKIDLKINQNDTDRIGVINGLKDCFTWKEILEFNQADSKRWYFKTINEDDLVWVKKLYENPELTPLPKQK